MATLYRTKEGDTVDYVCFQYYGTTDGGQVESVLAANPGLAAYGPTLPSGVLITFPVVTPQPKAIVRLFG